MCELALRPIAFSYTDLSIQSFSDLQNKTKNFTTSDSKDKLLLNQTFIGIIALKDPLRDHVRQTIETTKKGGINIRLVSGDNLDTAKAYAIDVGILSKEVLEP
jgi:Ca2+-transporting ATPase